MVIVPIEKQALAQCLTGKETVNATNLGKIIQYKTADGSVKDASGWGDGPSKEFEKWLSEQYSEIFDYRVQFI